MWREIREQPDVLRRLLLDGREAIDRVAAAIRDYAPRFAVLVARGTSDHAAAYGKYLLETRLGVPASLAAPSTTTLYHSRPRLDRVLYIAISQSGESPDVVLPTRQAAGSGALTVAITNQNQSPLSAVAAHTLQIMAGEEKAVAATKSYTASLLTLFLLIEAVAGRDAREANDLPQRCTQLLDRQEALEQIALRYRDAEQILITSRGYNEATAREAALKLVEGARIPAVGFSGADLLHGPIAMVERGFPVIAFIPPEAGGRAMGSVVESLLARAVDLLLLGPQHGPAGTTTVLLPDMRPEYLSPVLAIVPFQILALSLGRLRGYDPDRPAGLAKVTRTL